jgi:Rieske Fe-S protein
VTTLASKARSERFVPLIDPVEVALDQVPVSGSAAPFKAWVTAPATEAGELLLRGTVWRLDSGSIAAFSVLCPHEICEVERVADAADLAQRESVVLPRRPLLACPCHFSVFDPEARGVPLVGPAPRGLYRFGLELEGGRARIDRIEAALVDRFAVTPDPSSGDPR